jgi:hypothetical protein
MSDNLADALRDVLPYAECAGCPNVFLDAATEALAEYDAQPAQAIGYITPDGHFYGYAPTETGGPYTPAARIDVYVIQPAQAAQPESEPQDCNEADGCPTELAVLKRFWREHQAAQPVGVPDGLVQILREAEELLGGFQSHFGVLPPDDEDDLTAWNRIERARKNLLSLAAPQPPAQPSAYCLACQSAGMRNCQHFDECSGATCATCHRPLNDIKQPSADAEDAGVHEFIKDIATQAPEKPDYWSTCGQCERNIQRAQELLDAARAAEGDGK